MTNTSITTSYERFCINMHNELKKKSKEGSSVHLQTVRKINGVVLRGITITCKGGNIMPTVYLDKFYRMYEEGATFEDVVTCFLREYERAGIEGDFDIQFFSQYEKVKPCLGFKLLNYEMNRELLEQVPYKKYLDLAMVCFCDVKDKRIGHGSILIKREHMDIWEVTEEQLMGDAMRNMPLLYPADFMNMSVVLRELFRDPAGLLDVELPMFVLTNKERINGAASLLYEGQLEQMANWIGEDFYVLPSSIHEVIIVPKSKGMDEEYLSRLVNEINQEQLAREEILANHAYCYDYKKKEMIPLPLIPNQKS